MKRKRLFQIFLCTLLTLAAHGRDLKFEYIGLEQGLSQSQVTAMVQDSIGFMWFGTYDGLNRYDGYQFTIFKHARGDSLSLSNNRINALCEPRSRLSTSLWVGTQDGLNAFHRHTETFTAFRHLANDSNSLSDNLITALMEDRFGRLWIGTSNGLTLYDPQSQRFRRFFNQPEGHNSTVNNHIYTILEDSDTTRYRLFIGTGNGLKSVEFRTPQIESEATPTIAVLQLQNYLHLPLEGLPADHYITGVCQDMSGKIWIVQYSGALYFLDNADSAGVREPVRFQDDRGSAQHRKWRQIRDATTMMQDHLGRLWIATQGHGLFSFLPPAGQLQHFREYENVDQQLFGDYLLSLYEDRSGRLWLGTNGSGINTVDRRGTKFKHLKASPHSSHGISHRSVLSVCEDRRGDVWIGTSNGLNRFNPGSGKMTRHKTDPRDPNTLNHNMVFGIHESSYYDDGRMWVATDSGVGLFDPHTNSFKRYLSIATDPASLPDKRVWQVIEDRQGTLWAATRDGLAAMKVDQQTNGHFVIYKHDPANPNSISDNQLRTLYEDNREQLWIGAYEGLNRLDRTTGEFRQYLSNPEDPRTLSNNFIQVIFQDSINDPTGLWVGTWDGLNRLDLDTEIVTRYSEADGLPNHVVVGGASDARGNLWLSTFNGLSKFNPATSIFRNYRLSDGLQSLEFNFGASEKGASGQLYFGGIGGLNIFHPDSVRDNQIVSPVIISEFKVFNQSVKPGQRLAGMSEPLLKKTISETQRIVLPQRCNFFSIEVVALDYTAIEDHRYAYQLEGFDKDWVEIGNRHFISFTNLDAGTYMLRVKGANNDGIWNTVSTCLEIVVAPPFWNTWWFKLIIFFGLLLIPLLIYRNRLIQLLAIERLRVRIASDLHDNIGATLTAVAMQSDLVNTGLKPELQREKLAGIALACREAGRMLNDVVWSIDARNDRIENLIDRIRDFADLMLVKQGVTVDYSIIGLDFRKLLPIELRQNLYLLSKEAITNIAKYARATQVDITLENHNGKFVMKIRDNGVGIDSNPRRSGHGLRNMKLRAQRIQGKLTFENKNGYTVQVTLPAI